jgi:outer membrane biosynthesis protein TonB
MKFVILYALFALLFASVLCDEGSDSQDTIKLHVFGSSSKWWIAVDPIDEIYETVGVEVREASSPRWIPTSPNTDWGYFQLASDSGIGFALPLSFRFTAINGQRAVASSVLTTISEGLLVDTGVQYPVKVDPPTDSPTDSPTDVPTEPSDAPTPPATLPPATQGPSQPPVTQPPTQPPATQPPTQPATQPPATQPPATQPPVTQPPATQPPTQKPTQPATQPPATQPPTQKPTQPATPVPTQPPATQAPTTKPTSPPTTDLCAIVPTSTEPLQILVPLYVYPGSAWDQLATAAATGVKIIAIINPNSGPNANGPDSSYSTYITKLKNAGVDLVGYVHTSWGARAIATIESEIDTYANKYPGLSGIFFDEGATEASALPYYTTAYNYVKAKSGYTHVILNPGLQPDQGYLSVSTNIVIYENYASSLSSTSFSSWVACAPNSAAKSGYKYKFSGIVHTATLANMPTLISQVQAKGMGLVYVTDGAGGCCTYNTLTSFFPQEAASVKSLNSA